MSVLKICNLGLYRQKGFGLVELMVVVVIIGIVAMIATPSIDYTLKNQRNKQTIETVIAALREARSDSVLRHQDVVVTYNNSNLVLTQGSSVRSYKINPKVSIVIGGVGRIVFRSNKTATATNIEIYCTTDKSVVGATVTMDGNGNVSSSRSGKC